MAIQRTIIAPPENVARNEVIDIEEATTLLKALIANEYKIGSERKITNAKASKIISEYARKFINRPRLFNQVRISLLTFYNNAYYTHFENMKVLNRGLTNALIANKVVDQLGRLTYKGTSYTLSLNTLLNDGEIRATDLLSDDRFRGLRTDARLGRPLIKNYQKLVRQRYLELATQQPLADQTPLRLRAETQVRYEETLKDLNKVETSDNDLWWTSSHINCSKRCEPYQGKLYSKSGKTGTIDGNAFTPLQDALDANDGNSIISGYGCRHYLIPYQSNSRPPKDYDARKIASERAIDQKQRYYETQIRAKKQLEAVQRSVGNTVEADRLNNRWHKQYASYQQFSLNNNRPIQKWRTQLFRQNNQFVPDDRDE